ncbi:hypothetical protein AB0C76_10580 [Kitasatospora sp. NPDC048722]|uniref:hypothetical protein n=1 Tax=Kitasatospora sp. NPDC048722 TaxID=3155639 RepID=UPI0033F8DAA3
MRLAGRVAKDPHGPDTHRSFANCGLTRSSWLDSAIVHHIVVPSRNAVLIIEADMYDHTRGFDLI